LLELVDDFGCDSAHLKGTDTSEIVDEEYGVVALADLEERSVFVRRVEHVLEHSLHHARQIACRPLRARLVVNSHPDFELVLFQLILSTRSSAWHMDVRKRASNRDRVVGNQLGHLVDVL
jgi:hypothetical protein